MELGIGEPMQIEQISKNDRCYWAELPGDIYEHILLFLLETEEEFIVRTRTEERKPIPKWCHKLLPDYDIGTANKLIPEEWGTDKKTVVFLQFLDIDFPRTPVQKPLLTIITENRIVHNYEFDKKSRVLALSPCGKMIATIDTVDNNKNDNQQALGITHLGTKQTQTFDIPTDFILPNYGENKTVAFNTCGDKVIVHERLHKIVDIDNGETKEIQRHIIVPIAIPSTEKIKKYFAQRAICKNLIEQGY
jgi:hypothetical protein